MEDDLLCFLGLPDLMTDVVGNPEGTSAHTSGDDTTLMARTEANSHEQPLGDPMQANSETLDGQRLNRLLANPSSLTPVDAQWFLRQKDSLVSSGLVSIEASINVTLGNDGIHFLDHKTTASSTPLFNLGGPSSGTLYAGSEAYPDVALLKLAASKNPKAGAGLWTEAHAGVSVSAWREVEMKEPARQKLSTGTVRGPKLNVDYGDLSQKVSLITFYARSKRQRSAIAGPSSEPEAADATQGKQSASFGTLEVDELRVGKSATVSGNLAVKGTIYGQLESQQADFAEWFRRANVADALVAGDVVLRDGNTISHGPVFSTGPPPHGASYFVVSDKPCLQGGVPSEPNEKAKGNLVAFLGQVDVKVRGEARDGEKLVPSGQGDGCAVALPPEELDDERASFVIGLVIGPSEIPGCVLAFVSHGLASDLTLPSLLEQIRGLKAGEERLAEALKSVLALAEPPTAQADERWLARKMAVSRVNAATKGGTVADLPAETVNDLLHDGQLSLAGTLMVMLGWQLVMDEDGEQNAGAERPAAAAATELAVCAPSIFKRLGESDLNFQKVLMMWMGRLALPPLRLEALVDEALRRSRKTESPRHTAGSWFKKLLCELWKAVESSAAVASSQPKVARAYQSELVERVCELRKEGRNAIIVSPTASGKTLVSALVIQRALEDALHDGVVVYLEKIRHLVKQQKKQLDDFFLRQGASVDFVGHYVGGDSYIPAWSIIKQRHKVVVLTADLFLQRLASGEARGSDCRLVVFDECHSATGNHSYNKVNLELKRCAEKSGSQLPHILGMTATPTWKDTFEENMSALATLCKNMNDAELLQVIDNRDNLSEHVHEPNETRHPLRLRALDEAFKRELPAVMEMLERDFLLTSFGYDRAVEKAMSDAATALGKVRCTPNAPQGYSKVYEKTIRTWQDSFQLQSSPCSLAKLVLQLLSSLNAASSVTDEVGFESAQCLLGAALFRCIELAAVAEGSEGSICREAIKSVLESRVCQERFVRPLLDGHPLSPDATMRNCSPKLAKLVECLQPHEHDERPLKGIIFVQTRASAHRVVNFIDTHPQLKGFVRPAVFCGHAEMTSRAQEAVARAFDLGQINVLIATSVAEEGLDVPDTRVAIMLDGITSGRVRVQCRGRVMRRPGGAFHILYYTGSAEDVGVWRSQQQVDASHKALEELAADPQAIASLSVGPNPLVQLNTLKQKGIVEGPQFEGTEHSVNGMFHVTVTLTLVKTGREIVAAATDKNKRKAKAAAVERAVATLLEGQSAELR